MLDYDEEFLRELLQTFQEDAEERIRLLSQAVVELETAHTREAALVPLESMYRETHSLKGASGAVEQAQMESLCQQMESVLAALKSGELEVTPPLVDTLSGTVDCLHDLLIQKPGCDECAAEFTERLSAGAVPAPKKTSSPQGYREATPVNRAPEPAATTDNVRVSTAKLEAIMLQAEELIAVKLAARQRSTALQDICGRVETWKRELYQARISGDTDKMHEFLEWNTALVDGLLADMRMISRVADDERRSLGPMVDELLESMKRVLMLPVSSLLSTFPKMVRDLARSSGKAVESVITGADIEIDKRIIENLKDPLIHILRNSVDHGIESPEVRRAAGKPESGRIAIAVSQLDNNKIEILISDDGAGIDTERLREVVQQEGLRTKAQMAETSDSELFNLAFASGVSTSRQVSTISGRGLGLAIVEEKVLHLGGSVTVESHKGVGTTFRLHVPATLATARGILAQVSDWLFVVPVVGVERVVRVEYNDIRSVEARDTIRLGEQTIPLVRMNEVLDLPLKPQRDRPAHLQVMVIGSGESRIAFVVDSIISEQEVIVKTAGPQLQKVRNIAGVTILGSGKVVPILNVVDILSSAAARPARGSRQTGPSEGVARKAVLIAEDSITSRMLLKNVLEAAGYYVRPTVDGMDALSALGEEEFDLVVSDIEMPRMDGIELTRKIRSDKRLARLPVVLVTGRESEEDRERGLDAGANAYLTKSSFNQGTLLKTARSLL